MRPPTRRRPAPDGDPPVGVPGFRAAGLHCGIKPKALDLALLASDVPAAAAGVFTRSTVVGAPVELDRERIESGRARAIVVNSGVSNVAMGARGRRDAREMTSLAAQGLGCSPDQVLVASTGVIGEPLPMDRLRSGIPAAVEALSETGIPAAAEAILTTDTRPKIAFARTRIDRRWVHVAGIAKGSGMIAPRMATMLAFVLTDAAVSPRYLRRIWRDAVDASLNRVTVDAETSTSDTAIVLANGVAGNAPLRSGRSAGAPRFARVLEEVCVELARDLARDGEGATRLVTVRVVGARSRDDAERAARRVADSVLVKTAVFGGDPNWGRILQAVGAGGVRLALERSEVRVGGVVVFRKGSPVRGQARARAGQAIAGSRGGELELRVDLGVGQASAHFWTCDLSYDYVKINAESTT